MHQIFTAEFLYFYDEIAVFFGWFRNNSKFCTKVNSFYVAGCDGTILNEFFSVASYHIEGSLCFLFCLSVFVTNDSSDETCAVSVWPIRCIRFPMEWFTLSKWQFQWMASLDIVPQFHIVRCLVMSKQQLSMLEYTWMHDSDREFFVVNWIRSEIWNLMNLSTGIFISFYYFLSICFLIHFNLGNEKWNSWV